MVADGGEDWDTVHHRHGVGQMNEAGEVLPSLGAL